MKRTHRNTTEKNDLLPLPQKLPPILPRHLSRRIPPRLQSPSLLLINGSQVLRRATKQVGRPQNMRRMVIKLQVMVNNGEIGMVCFDEVLQRAGAAIRRRFDVVDGDAGKGDRWRRPAW